MEFEPAKLVKCVHCGKVLVDRDEVWQVKLFRVMDNKIQMSFNPACSYYCADMERAKNVEWLEGLAYDASHQSLQKMSVIDYLSGGHKVTFSDPCERCIHKDCCGIIHYGGDANNEKDFLEHCCGCPCGDGTACNRSVGQTGCTNFEYDTGREEV